MKKEQRKPVDEITLGIVIPCYNEEDVIPLLYQEMTSFMEQVDYAVNVLFVNDGSADQTASMLGDIVERDERFALINLSRNFGHQTAVTAGLNFIHGDVVGVIDADLQDPPQILDGMLGKWHEGYDVVYGIRKNRKESPFLRSAYAVFYRILRKIANVNIPLDAGDFSIMDRKVVNRINSLPEHNRFIRGLRGWVGFKQTGYEYERSPRAAGKPKYNLGRLMQLAFDGIVTMSSFPLRIASWIGAISAVIGFIYSIYAFINALFFDRPPSGWTSLVILIIFFGGVQLIVLGIIGEYLGRVFDEVKSRPHFIISTKKGWVDQAENSSVLDQTDWGSR